MNQKAKDLASKLLELARRGEGGERQNAETMLASHLAKYGMNIQDFEADNEIHFAHYHYLSNDPLKRNAMYMQIVASVIGKKRCYELKLIHKPNGRSYCRFAVSMAEKVEIETKIPIYWNDFLSQLQIFKEAYIQKNMIYAKDDGGENEDAVAIPEEIERAKKVLALQQGIDLKRINKELNFAEG